MEARGATLSGTEAVAVPAERVAALIRRYVIAGTAILLVAGALGLVMRQSQADIARVGDNFFYAAMTAHGLGAFAAWAGFTVMGIGLWVLVKCGLGMRPLAYALADLTWWATVAGTAGIVVSTLLLGFGGSWVFLYPLPFYAANQWSDATTAVFSASVLLVGVGILTWCAAVLHTVVGPESPAASKGVMKRFAVSIGLGILFPSLLDEPRRQIPYAVIPLAVIAVDMLIATLPLAVLLVLMIIQSIDPSVTVDPLLAKNMLWFFGHPVVYLLLFPAVAVYYLLIPRYAGRPLAAGGILAIGWLIGVIANVTIWAHHIYLDYPQESFQDVVNVTMEPITFSITLVSALSLYSLAATMWRTKFDWNPASAWLIAGLIGWITAGLSGVVNATIAFDAHVHNTLWIVGHFHHMAFLNIGAAIFGGIYAFLPELTGREWYSRRLGNWHLWMTMVGGYAGVVIWYVQGLMGAPRRYSVLPATYDSLTDVALPFIVLMAVGQLVFAYNLVQTLRGRRRVRDDRPAFADGRLVNLAGATAVLMLVPVLALGFRTTSSVQPATGAGVKVKAPGGEQTFVSTCGGCHTLSAAGTSGTVGPNLDDLKPDQQRVLNAIQIGGTGTGAMPANLLQGSQATDVAKYVSSAAGGG